MSFTKMFVPLPSVQVQGHIASRAILPGHYGDINRIGKMTKRKRVCRPCLSSSNDGYQDGEGGCSNKGQKDKRTKGQGTRDKGQGTEWRRDNARFLFSS